MYHDNFMSLILSVFLLIGMFIVYHWYNTVTIIVIHYDDLFLWSWLWFIIVINYTILYTIAWPQLQGLESQEVWSNQIPLVKILGSNVSPLVRSAT